MWGCTLAPPGEYDGMIDAAAATRAVAIITLAIGAGVQLEDDLPHGEVVRRSVILYDRVVHSFTAEVDVNGVRYADDGQQGTSESDYCCCCYYYYTRLTASFPGQPA